MVALEPSGRVDSSLISPISSRFGAAAVVHSIAVQADDKCIVAGYFTNPRSGIARLNQDGSTVDTSFEVGTGANTGVHKIVVTRDGKILIGGDFSSINGLTHHGIARLNVGDFALPFVDVVPTNQTTTAGQKVSFSIRAGGYPNPTYQWLANDQIILTRRSRNQGVSVKGGDG